MAMRANTLTEDHIDHDAMEGEQFDLRNFRCPRLDQIDASRVAVTYDRFSDTLIVHLHGKNVPSISVPVQKYDYMLVSPDGREFLGFQIEGFLAQAVKDEPRIIEMLNFAELRGITPAEVQALRDETLSAWMRITARFRRIFTRGLPERRQQAVGAFLKKEGKELKMQAAAC